MIDIEQQEKLFIALGNALGKKVTVYAIGGTAMMLRGLKDSTLDVDFVFDSKEGRIEVLAALKKLGAKDSDVTLVYGLKENTPAMMELENARFDLFMNKVVTSTFSRGMKERAKQIHEFGKNLIVKAASPQDILLMKSATSRTKDFEDIVSIVKKSNIDWNMLAKEAEEQVNLGNETAIMYLGEKLEDLNNMNIISIPKKMLDDMFEVLKRQISKKSKEIRKKKYHK